MIGRAHGFLVSAPPDVLPQRGFAVEYRQNKRRPYSGGVTRQFGIFVCLFKRQLAAAQKLENSASYLGGCFFCFFQKSLVLGFLPLGDCQKIILLRFHVFRFALFGNLIFLNRSRVGPRERELALLVLQLNLQLSYFDDCQAKIILQIIYAVDVIEKIGELGILQENFKKIGPLAHIKLLQKIAKSSATGIYRRFS